MIMLILFQSFSAVANSQDYHAIDPQHLSEVHEHELDDNILYEKTKMQLKSDLPSNADDSFSSESSHNPADCHHCGHCNGTHAQWVGNTAAIQLNSLATKHTFYYLSSAIDTPVTQLLRPPKA